jgi:hypothetical protein
MWLSLAMAPSIIMKLTKSDLALLISYLAFFESLGLGRAGLVALAAFLVGRLSR